jgi:hypothetical protein
MWRVESLLLLYVMAGIAMWTWVVCSFPARSRRQARRQYSLRRQRAVVITGVGSIASVAVLSAAVGLVDASGAILASAALVACAQLMFVLAFTRWFVADLLREETASAGGQPPVGDRATSRHSSQRRLRGRRRSVLGVQGRSAL